LRRTLAERRIAEAGSPGALAPLPLGGKASGSGDPSRLYCVIDLSGGPGAKRYPVKYLAAPPSGWTKEKGWPDEYKTTKLVMRRIEPGTFIMGEDQADETHRVTLTKPFYIGVFEVTQRQCELLYKWNPAKFKGGARPAQLRYTDMRGGKKGAMWPATPEVDADSFIGKLRSMTGLAFDLPTEAEWEYACRAGTTSKYNNGGDTEDDLKKLGRYKENQSDDKGGYTNAYTAVGSYLPNAWGLYDMHGNVWEVCLGPGTGLDTTNPGRWRVQRGGSYESQDCPSTARTGVLMMPSYRALYPDSGFRLIFHPDAETAVTGSR
ncbi:MAG: SUMF1/EgtB/PvdO family nonheme iron enzyme, partial [Kiritimatiellae bacterium]|nr:SUMF1/EgtB/PvdO family nonheme iron enzyme [Kiritimatiellia bacterium]